MVISFKFLLLIGLVACLSGDVLGLSCKNEKGEDIDWFVLLKPPKDKTKSDKGLAAGTGYGYVESGNPSGNWKLGQHDLNDPKSFTGQTFAEVYKNPEKFSYVQYNDGKPDGFGNDSSTYAHAKGALVWDNESAVWLVHSVPKFMSGFHGKSYEYPSSGTGNGQNFLCVTVDAKTYADKILLHIATMKAQVYSTHISNKLDKGIAEKVAPIINVLAQKDGLSRKEINKYEPNSKVEKVDKKRRKELITELVTKKNGEKFTAIVKSRKDNVDVWSAIAATVMKAKEFVVRTWTMAQPVANLLGATCMRKGAKPKEGEDEPANVLNVVEMELKFDNSKETVAWEKKDHSKWGVCTEGGNNCYCAGDMNRATSQFKRGGGVVCMHNAKVNEAWKKTVTNRVLCNQNTEHPVQDKKK